MSEASETPSSKLQFFPVMFFASGMGIGGAGLVLQKITKVFDMSTFFHVIAGIVDVLSALVLVTVTVVYLRKVKNYWPEVKKELFHPMRINFFAALAISTLIVQMLLESLHVPFGVLVVMFYFAALFQLFFSLHVIRYWFAAEIKQKMASPAWFVPIVGNIIVPVAASKLNAISAGTVPYEISIFYFSMGSFFWIILAATLFNRLVFGESLPPKFVPTLFIFIAPPSIFGVSVTSLFEGMFDPHTLYVIATISFNVALFFALLMIIFTPTFFRQKFAMSWWAYTFPMAAFSLCALELYHMEHSHFYECVGIIGAILTILIVATVAVRTLIGIRHTEICILEE